MTAFTLPAGRLFCADCLTTPISWRRARSGGGGGESCTDELAAGPRDRRCRQDVIDAMFLSEPTQ